MDESYYDPRLDPDNEEEFNWQALSDRNDDLIADFSDDEWAKRRNAEGDFEQDFLTRPESHVAAEFVRDRERSGIMFGAGGTVGHHQAELTLEDYLQGNGLA